jgi:small nuclear ribonucleoprotein (snRNP)-like protein
MKDLKVTTNEVEATICFDKDTRIEGTIFLGTGQWASSLASKVSAYLEDDKEFVPFQIKGKGPAELINKNNIKTVEWTEDGNAGEDELTDASHKQEVTITFTDNETITGTLVSDTPQERSRLSDCLNTKDEFIHITDDKRHIHVNKSMLLRVTGP